MSCEDYDLCPVLDIEVLIDQFSAVLWVATRMSCSHIGGASESACPVESADYETCCAGTPIGFV